METPISQARLTVKILQVDFNTDGDEQYNLTFLVVPFQTTLRRYDCIEIVARLPRYKKQRIWR